MWALPTLSVLDAPSLLNGFNRHELWCLLLFPKADRVITDSLRHNWETFSQALGSSAHVVTLLESEDPNSARGLRFPPDYEATVGKFCHDLRVRIDELPVLFLLNGSDNRGPPYWSLRRESLALGSRALVTLVSDICESTNRPTENVDAEVWRNDAAQTLLEMRSASELVRFLSGNMEKLQSLALWIVEALKKQTGA